MLPVLLSLSLFISLYDSMRDLFSLSPSNGRGGMSISMLLSLSGSLSLYLPLLHSMSPCWSLFLSLNSTLFVSSIFIFSIPQSNTLSSILLPSSHSRVCFGTCKGRESMFSF